MKPLIVLLNQERHLESITFIIIPDLNDLALYIFFLSFSSFFFLLLLQQEEKEEDKLLPQEPHSGVRPTPSPELTQTDDHHWYYTPTYTY